MGVPILLLNRKMNQAYLGNGSEMNGDDIITFLILIKKLKWDLGDVESPDIVKECGGASDGGDWSDDLKKLGFEVINE